MDGITISKTIVTDLVNALAAVNDMKRIVDEYGAQLKAAGCLEEITNALHNPKYVIYDAEYIGEGPKSGE